MTSPILVKDLNENEKIKTIMAKMPVTITF